MYYTAITNLRVQTKYDCSDTATYVANHTTTMLVTAISFTQNHIKQD